MIDMPPRIARLERDHRGYPIPWNVLRGDNGEANFTINDDRRHRLALRSRLCPLCGERLGRWLWFTGGPRSAFDEHGWYLDLPGHHECVQFALRVCPYLALPKYLSRDYVNPATLPAECPHVFLDQDQIKDRPEIFVAVAGSEIEVSETQEPMLPYVRPVRPVLAYEYWRHGEQIPLHRAMPILRGIFGAEWTPPPVEEG